MIIKNDKTGQYANEWPEVFGPLSTPWGYISTDGPVGVEARNWKNTQNGWRESSQEEYDAEMAANAAQAQLEIDRQAAKDPELIAAENKYMLLCQQLTGAAAPVKLGFDQLDAIIKSIPDQLTAAAVAIELLAIDAQGKRYAGNRWWDDITWHA